LVAFYTHKRIVQARFDAGEEVNFSQR